MPHQILFVIALALVIPACGPSKAELRAKLQQVDRELATLEIAEQQYKSQETAAKVQAFVGGFATGYGATNGDAEMAGRGAGAVHDAIHQGGNAEQQLQQIRARMDVLLRERTVLSSKLK